MGCGLWTLSCDFVPHNYETLKWLSSLQVIPVVTVQRKLQALVYDILPSTTDIFSYAIGSRKLSANEQFFVGAQTVVRLLQTTQIISDICFITNHVAYTSSNKTKITWIETEPFFLYLPGVDAPHVYSCVLGR